MRCPDPAQALVTEPRRYRGLPGLMLSLVLLGARPLLAQELEPRSYSNVPIGMNFFIVGYAYSSGILLFDPSIPLEDAELTVDMPLLGYARSIDIAGLSSKVSIVQPYACLSGTATLDGEGVSRDVCGPTDTSIKLNVNFFGAPALSLKEFSAYRQNWIVGGALRLQLPTGQYDDSRLVNLGSNRWRINPEIGVSKAIGNWILELALAASFYTDNDDYVAGLERKQAPIYALQAHVIYSLPKGMWLALDANFYRGGETSIDGVERDNALENSRFGVTFALPLSRRQSLKLYGQTGIVTRTGSDADTLGIAWQYRWAKGF